MNLVFNEHSKDYLQKKFLPWRNQPCTNHPEELFSKFIRKYENIMLMVLYHVKSNTNDKKAHGIVKLKFSQNHFQQQNISEKHIDE